MKNGGYQNRSYWIFRHDHYQKLEAVGYVGLGEGFNRVTYQRRIAAAKRSLVASGMPRGVLLLEAGVGVGAYAQLWNELGVRHWTGIDISAKAIQEVRQTYPGATFILADIARGDLSRELPEAGGFDVVTAIDVLYHITDDAAFDRALKNLASQVREGGRLLVSDIFVEEQCRIAAHVVRRPMASYLKVLAPLGFELRAREPVFAILGDPVGGRGPALLDFFLFNIWRGLSKAVRTTPGRFRAEVGYLIASAAMPVDRLLRALGVASGRNLEMALFQRVGARDEASGTAA